MKALHFWTMKNVLTNGSHYRSQSLNRFMARRELVRRLERLKGLVTDEDRETEKLRKQKSKKKKRTALKYHPVDR